MPRSRTYTSEGYLEVQWHQKGEPVCIVSAGKDKDNPEGPLAGHEVMHQFTLEDAADLRQFAKSLRRAMKQAHKNQDGNNK